ncbi:MAG: hypothetical protein OEL20_04885 [Sulfuritalea sp.]|nr:hypothetical protein [Sulfuritalea sp.]
MCDVTKPQEDATPDMDRDLGELKADWHSVARYRVYRSQFEFGKGTSKRTLHTNLHYEEACRTRVQEDATLRLEPGYHPDIMGRPMIGIELEQPEATYAKYKEVRASREAAKAKAPDRLAA